MGILPESAEEFRSTYHTILLGSEELSSIKSEDEPAKSGSRRSKKRVKVDSDGSKVPGVPAKRKRIG